MKTIIQKVKFPASAETVYNLYMDSRLHSKSTEYFAEIDPFAGGEMSSLNGYVRGKFLLVKPGKKIVQIWRGSDWNRHDLDSICLLSFEDRIDGCVVTLVHDGLPDGKYESTKKGWKEYYWKPWKIYLLGYNKANGFKRRREYY